MRVDSSTVITALRILVLARLALHALFNPVYEGPDEPFHLARAVSFQHGLTRDAMTGSHVDQRVAESVASWPCCPDLHAAFACPEFSNEPASFNILSPPRRAAVEGNFQNYQAHQPVLPYAVAGAILEALGPITNGSPERQLLLLRIASVLLIGLALCFPVRWISRRYPSHEPVLLLLLLVPGAAESLVRAANDALVFAWSAVLIAAVFRNKPTHPPTLAILSALGPLLKLTALPVVAFATALVLASRRKRLAIVMGLSGLVVFPLQWLRGWAWGGTLEANRLALDDSVGTVLLGLAHSAYTFLKTALWLGGWSVFKPPRWMLFVLLLFVILVFFRFCALRLQRTYAFAHVAGLLVAGSGLVLFAIGKRQVFGEWGAVGGWYLWAWAPWLALLLVDTATIRGGRRSELLATTGALLVLLNVLWFVEAVKTYG